MCSSKNHHYISPNIKLSEAQDGEFYENGIELSLEKEEAKFTEEHFKNRIKEEVSNFINQSFDSIVVLAGAGASVVSTEVGIDKGFGKTMLMIAENIAKEMGDLNSEMDETGGETCESIEDLQKPSEDIHTLEELANISNYKIPIKKDGKFNYDFNLEDFLSNILTIEQFLEENEEKTKFIRSKEKILRLIKENTNYDFKREKMKHATFLKILLNKTKKENKLTIVTTNYDTLFEEAAESMGITVIDGFSFSYNPYFDSDMFNWKLVKSVPNVKTKQLEYKENVINLLKIHGSLTWERSEDGKRIRRKSKNHVKNPIMVFPSSNKYAQSYDEPYFELFTKFQEELRNPNTLLITTGFSFADNHISTMITQAIKHNPGLNVLVSDRNIEQDNENWLRLDNLRENHFKIAFLKATFNDDLTDYMGGSNEFR